MTKNLNEANVKVDLSDFNTDDLSTLSDIFKLAGLISTDENGIEPTVGLPAPATIGTPIDRGFVNLDDLDTDTDADSYPDQQSPDITEPLDDELPVVDTTADLPDAGAPVDTGAIDGAVDADSVSYDDIGDEPAEFADDDYDFIDDEPVGDESDYDDGIDVDRLSELAGIDDLDRDEPMLESDRILPDLSLNEFEDTDQSEDEHHGPFASADQCRFDAESQTGGVEGDHFMVNQGNDGFYWYRTLGEDVNRPEPEQVAVADTIKDPIYQVHPKRTHPGDNKMLAPDLDETVDTVYEDISAKFRKFFK